MNMISRTTIDIFGLKVEPYTHPFKVAWVDKTFLPFKECCLVILKLGVYSEKIYCEVLPMSEWAWGRPKLKMSGRGERPKLG